MEYTIIGIEYRDYTNKAGKHITGYNLYVSYEAKGIDGIGCLREWVSVETMRDSGVKVGDVVELLYNRYARVDTIRLVG